jgi:hypothetical protein
MTEVSDKALCLEDEVATSDRLKTQKQSNAVNI